MTPILLLKVAVSSGCVFLAVMLSAALLQEFLDAQLDRCFALRVTRWRELRMGEARLRFTLRGWFVLQTLVPLALLTVGAWPLAVTAGLLLSRLPTVMMDRWIRQEEQRLEDQMVAACRGMANGVLAGLSIPQGLETAADSCEWPLSRDLRESVVRLRRGQTVGEVLETLRDRLQLDGITMFCRVLEVADLKGGPLNQKLSRLAESLQEWSRVRRRLESETASARFSVLIMSLCPIGFMIMFSLMGMNSVSMFFVTMPGQVVLSVICLLIWSGNRWASRILRMALQ